MINNFCITSGHVSEAEGSLAIAEAPLSCGGEAPGSIYRIVRVVLDFVSAGLCVGVASESGDGELAES